MDSACQYGLEMGGPHPLSAIAGAQTLENEMVRAVVRGELPLSALKHNNEERAASPLAVSETDLAEGILNLKDDQAALTEWANFVLTASELFKLEDGVSDYWDRLLSCIWELSFGQRLSIAALTLACAVRNRRRWA